MSQFVKSYGRPTDLVPVNLQTIDPLLVSLLELCTPHGQEHHIASIIRKQPYVKSIIADKVKGNILVRVGEDTEQTVFSCHMDIVGNNSKDAIDKGLVERIHLLTPDPDKKENALANGMIYGAKRYKKENAAPVYVGSTLGADDKVGVFICLKMIEAAISGLYIFHTGEECGAIGSSYLAKEHKNLFEHIKMAVAFDRSDYGDVINYQRGRKCASKEFGEALAAQLNLNMPPKQKFKSDVTGSFTDTASYMDFIPECTNVSVGYFNQHGSSEHLDALWLQQILLPAILKVDWKELPIQRDPTKTEHRSYSYDYGNRNSNVVDINRTSWDEATITTQFSKFPLWEPKLGYILEADPKVVKMAIGYFLNRANWGQQKEAFIDSIYWNYEYIDILEDEIDALREQLKTKNKKKGKEDAIQDTKMALKKHFLTELIKIGEVTQLSNDKQTQWLKGHLIGARYWLKSNIERNHTDNFTEKELVKLNKLLYSIACLVDMVGQSDPHTKLLDELETYIKEHLEEEGFLLSKEQIEIQRQSAIGISTNEEVDKHKQLAITLH